MLLLAVVALGGPAGATAPEAPRATSAAGSPARIVWPGFGVEVYRASGQLHRLDRTTPAFQKLVRHQLDSMFRGYLGSDPDCAQAPLVVVKEFRRSGFAFISDEGTFTDGPGHPPAKCAGGGAARIYVRIDGHWRAPGALGTQEAYQCRVLRRFDVPRMSGTHSCYDRRGELVAYAG